MTLGSTQPLTEMCTRSISWGKDGRYLGLTTLPPACTDCLESLGTQPHAALQASLDIYTNCFTTKPILRHNKNWSYFELFPIEDCNPSSNFERNVYVFICVCVCVCVCVCARARARVCVRVVCAWGKN